MKISEIIKEDNQENVMIIYKIVNNKKIPVAKFRDIRKAYEMLDDIKKEYPDEKYKLEHIRQAKTVYEETSSETDMVGRKNWKEIQRAMKFVGPKTDPLHNARLMFGDMMIPLEKNNGDLMRLYRWVKNHLGNNEQTMVFNRLGNLMNLHKLVQSMKPPKINENYLLTKYPDTIDIYSKIKLLESELSDTKILIENIDNNLVLELEQLESYSSDDLEKNKNYILLYLGIINNKVVLLQPISNVKLIDYSSNVYTVLYNNKVVTYPNELANKIYTKVYLIDNKENFEKIAKDLIGKFNLKLTFNEKLDEKKKRKKSRKLPRVYGGWFGFGGESGEGGGVEENKQLNKKTLTPSQLSKLHNIPVKDIEDQLFKGMKIELEHTDDKKVAMEIALDHLKEDPKYYDKLSKLNLEEDTEKVWMITYVPKEELRKQSAVNRVTKRVYFKDEEDSMAAATKLKNSGHDVYTPVLVSKKNMAPYEKLNENVLLQNSQKTQVSNTINTYKKGLSILDEHCPNGKTLDYGSGLGLGAKLMESDSFEPYPKNYVPTYLDTSNILSESYDRITNYNVLNVVPKHVRDNIVMEIGRILKPNGIALITTRGRDVMTIKGEDGFEPMSKISKIGTYQKGFTTEELYKYVKNILGENFEINKIKLGPAGISIIKKNTKQNNDYIEEIL